MNYRKKIVALITFLGGIYFFLEFVLPPEIAGVQVDRYHEQITVGFITVGSMALGLGLINLLRLHGSKIIYMRRGALNSAALLAGLGAMMSVTIWDWRDSARDSARAKHFFMLRDFARRISTDGGPKEVMQRRFAKLEDGVSIAFGEAYLVLNEDLSQRGFAPLQAHKLSAAREDLDLHRRECLRVFENFAEKDDPKPDMEHALERIAESLNAFGMRYGEWLSVRYETSLPKRVYGLFYDGLFVPLGSAMFSLLAFYMAAAAYRAFRVRSIESGLMMSAAVVVMLGQIPFGIWIWEGFPELRLWLLTVPNSAAFRGIALGAGVAGLVMAFRMWLSIESESFAGER